MNITSTKLLLHIFCLLLVICTVSGAQEFNAQPRSQFGMVPPLGNPKPGPAGIQRFDYDLERRTFYVTLTTGVEFQFSRVEPELFARFNQSGAKQDFFNTHIRHFHPCRRVPASSSSRPSRVVPEAMHAANAHESDCRRDATPFRWR